MANDLDKKIENIKEQSKVAMEAIEELKRKQRLEKSRKITGWIITLVILIVVVVVINLVSKAKNKNDDIQRVLYYPDTIATINFNGQDQCSITNNLKTANLYVATAGLGTYISPGDTWPMLCQNSSGTRQCYDIAASGLEDNTHQICNQ
jgi:hypothetical protein